LSAEQVLIAVEGGAFLGVGCRRKDAFVLVLKQRLRSYIHCLYFAFQAVYTCFQLSLFCESTGKVQVNSAQITGSADFAALEFYGVNPALSVNNKDSLQNYRNIVNFAVLAIDFLLFCGIFY